LYAFENAMTIVLALALYPSLGVRGLAVAWSAPYTVASLVAVGNLRRKLGSFGGGLTLRAVFRVGLATAVMAAVVEVLSVILPGGTGDGLLALRLVVEIGGGLVSYLLAARFLGISELQPVLRLARRLSR
ncbi:MAG: polysaccharide biosynthesis C-terminal domain-containing protein, partial [Acidimicrobiales bacterium]